MTSPIAPRVSAALLLLVLALLATSCAGRFRSRGAAPVSEIPSPIIGSPESLNEDLSDFVEFAEEKIANTSYAISEGASVEARRAAILWKLRMVDRYQKAFDRNNPGRSLTEMWLVSVRTLAYLRDGEGRQLFGPRQGEAVTASHEILRAIERLVQVYIDREAQSDLKRQVEHLAAATPMRQGFIEPRLDDASRSSEFSFVNTLLRAPLAPIRAVGSAGKEVSGLSTLENLVARISETIEDFPEELRWQTELLLIEVERSDMVTSALASLERFTQSGERLALMAESLPEEARVFWQQALDDLEQRNSELQASLSEARALAEQGRLFAEQSESALRESRLALIELERASESLIVMANALGDAAEIIKPLVVREGGDREGGVGIEDYRMAAESVADAAIEVRGTVEAIAALVTGIQTTDLARLVQDPTGVAFDRARLESQALVDRIFLRGVQFLGLLALLLIGWELLRWFLHRRRATA
jgi:predicted transcriptional regulator